MSPPTASSPEPPGSAALPHIFIDRSLGRYQVANILRDAGLLLTTMAEHYSEHVGQGTDDPDWIALTAERGWLGFNKDANIRRNAPERAAVVAHGARLFCVMNANITAAQAGDRYLTNLAAIARAARRPGPYIYGVYESNIERLSLDI